MKRSARADKRSYIEELAADAELAAVRDEMNAVYKITKRICGNNMNQPGPIKDKDGNILTTERRQASRWVEHFQEVLNHLEPDEPASQPLTS